MDLTTLSLQPDTTHTSTHFLHLGNTDQALLALPNYNCNIVCNPSMD